MSSTNNIEDTPTNPKQPPPPKQQIINNKDTVSHHSIPTNFWSNFNHRQHLSLNNNPSRVMNFQSARRLDSENKKNYKQIYSAGILPIFIKNECIYFLLGKGTNGEWSDFGGRSEISDKGRWDVTACREFYEESVGSILTYTDIVRRLQNKKNYIRVKGQTLNGSPYYMYVVKIPFDSSYKEKFKATTSFINYTKILDSKYAEKIEIQWISIDTIIAAMDGNARVINYPLRKVFIRTLEQNMQEIKQFAKQFYNEPYSYEH